MNIAGKLGRTTAPHDNVGFAELTRIGGNVTHRLHVSFPPNSLGALACRVPHRMTSVSLPRLNAIFVPRVARTRASQAT